MTVRTTSHPTEAGSPGPGPRPSSPGPNDALSYKMKRLFLGRPLSTARLVHERLGKPTALAVFSSDNLSSVAYATEEILRVLVPAMGLLAFSFVLPVSLVIVGIEAILIFSYRQTIKAYPTAGGAYIVTKDNFGLLPAQVAGVALLTDYVLTVSVSVAAGVTALSSVFDVVDSWRVPLALVFVWIIAYANLLGVRESGRLFSVPTYAFIGSLYLTVILGLFRAFTGSLDTLPVHQQPGAVNVGAESLAGVALLWLVAKAFASGGAAVTGVEAISNGVPAFKQPEWRNARTTLVWMGVILGCSFIAVSFLAAHLHALPTENESKSVLAVIGAAVYGGGVVGRALFVLLQVTTMMILVLAANTSFADFPRLANFHAGDAFLPRQFTKRGHRLVFSNGIVALAAAASVLLIAFNASVTRLIPLYALGVFTSFTLSQAGMARRHVKIKEPGWRTGLFFNGLGAIATAIVTLIIAAVKFSDGAWMILVAVPLLVVTLVRVNRTYEDEDEELSEGLEKLEHEDPNRRTRHLEAVVLVDAIDGETLAAMQYALTIGADRIDPVHLASSHREAAGMSRAWALAGPLVPLENLICGGDDTSRCLERYVRTKVSGRDVDVTVIVGAPSRMGFLERFRHDRARSDLTEHLRGLDNVNLVVVGDEPANLPFKGGRMQIAAVARHKVVIPVGKLDRSVVKAVRYARSIDALEVTALHVVVDPDREDQMIDDWLKLGHLLRVPIDIHDCVDRNIPRVVSEYVRDVRGNRDEVTVVLPRLEYPGTLHRLLHDRTSREIAQSLAHEPRVHVVTVPYRLQGRKMRARRDSGEPASSLVSERR